MSEEAALFCPNCQTVSMLKCGSLDSDAVIDRCPDCHGLWFDAGELRQMLKSDALKGRLLDNSPRATTTNAETTGSSPSGRECPRCNRALHGLELGGVSADVCVECSGLWLDSGELLLLVHAERGGQLEGDESSVAYELREGLSSGSLTPGLLRQLLDALKEWLNRG